MTMIKILVNLLLYFFLIVIRLLLLLLLILNPVFINMKFFDDWHEKKKQQEHLNRNLISHTKQKTHAEKNSSINFDDKQHHNAQDHTDYKRDRSLFDM